jgi:hypothetical protein
VKDFIEAFFTLQTLGTATIATILAMTAAWLLGKSWIQERVAFAFKQEIETHKHELQLLTEQARFQYSQKLTELNLYAVRKDAASALVYAAMRRAHGYLAGLRGLQVGLSFVEFNADDLTRHMTERQVPNGMQESILEEWKADRAKGIEKLRGYLRMADVQRAERMFNEAKNAMYENELYFSDSSIRAVNGFVDVCGSWLASIDFPPQSLEEFEKRPSRIQLDAALENVHTVLRAELSHTRPAAIAADPVDSHKDFHAP